ncbi:Chorion peroxidase like protein [Argiope bruennichi]|uniref:Chorion peroxidase like protein n=1 Tax=Argiope bruennichi TaxID=94029 RepID=A0A8T0EJH6_ARGBR|nr:Chorion peroxidase like protein [Argiope bruennichi]
MPYSNAHTYDEHCCMALLPIILVLALLPIILVLALLPIILVLVLLPITLVEILRFLVTAGFIPLILLTEAAADTSNNSPNGKVYFYSRHPVDTDCCSSESYKYPYCAAISVRPNDPFFAQYNQTCLFMHRTEVCVDCSAFSNEQVNAATSPLDASIVYGSGDRKAMKIRTYDGDKRVNQHAFLSSMETLFMRDHNRVATKLKKLNPHWEEERLYQEARRIVIANLQCITYKEYLPQLLGPYIMRKFDLGVRNTSDGTEYNPNIQNGVRNEFANAGFRLHSMIPKNTGSFGLKFRHASVEDVDLYVGMMLENRFPGSEVGPTAACLISKQFYFTKFGDRFYFEHEGEVPSFSEAQRNSLKQCSLARFLCDNLNITQVQKYPMLIPSSKNPEVLCSDIPKINLTHWRETP